MLYAPICTRTFKSTNILRRLWRVQEVRCESRPWLQKGWIGHNSTQLNSWRTKSPSRIRCEPMMNSAPMRAKPHVPSASSSSDFLNTDRSDRLIHEFERDRLIPFLMFAWRIFLASHIRSYHPRKLSNDKREKKTKYCKPFENQCRHFTPFVVSTDGMYGFEDRAFLKRLAKLLAEKMGYALFNSC